MHINFSNLHTSLWSCTTNYKDTAAGPPLTVDSCYSDIVGQEVIGQCQTEVKAADTSCSYWVTRNLCWFILNLIADGSIRVEWREPVQFNGSPSWGSNHGQHSRWGGGCGNINIMMKVRGVQTHTHTHTPSPNFLTSALPPIEQFSNYITYLVKSYPR